MASRIRRLCLLFAVAALCLGLTGVSEQPAAAQKGKGKVKVEHFDTSGHPTHFKRHEVTGYAIWHNGKHWHIRTTTKKRMHHFKGSITVEGGTFTRAHGHDLEKTGALADFWTMGPKKHTIRFDFKTDRGIDGIDFHVSKEAKLIRFNLHQDGEHRPHHVWIGHGNHHPHAIPFELVAHPHKKKKKKG